MHAMSTQNGFWSLALQFSGECSKRISPVLQQAVQASPFAGIKGWNHISLAYYIEPESLTPERVAIRNPYANPVVVREAIAALQAAYLLDENAVITPEALQSYLGLVAVQNEELGKITVSPDEMQTIGALLRRVSDHARTFAADQNRCLRDITRKAQPTGTPHDAFYGVYRLAAFRDDAHLVACRVLSLDAVTTEMLTMVWNGQAQSAETMQTIRGMRGWDIADWQAALDRLQERGWVQLDSTSEQYQMTEPGNQIRGAVEEQTDTLFYRAFEALSDEEFVTLRTLIQQVTDQLSAGI
jgi:DNA-binding MarR family transcriptional regulator